MAPMMTLAAPGCTCDDAREGRPGRHQPAEGSPPHGPRCSRAAQQCTAQRGTHQRDLHHASASCARLSPLRCASSLYLAAAASERSEW